MREGAVLFYVEPGGRITLASERGRKVMRESRRRASTRVEEQLGVSYNRLADAARDGVRVPTILGFVDVEPLVDDGGRSAGIIVRADADAARETPATDAALEIVIGADPSVRATFEIAERFAKTPLPVLVVAEEGAGALKLSRFIHAKSARSRSPLVEIEGTELGSPPEANERIAAIATATATLFVRSIDEASRAAQADLARALDGGSLADTRLVAWSRVDVRGKESFSPELARLVRASTVSLPPLRERTDRAVLGEKMLAALAPGTSLSAAAKRVIDGYDFPGNLSELEMVLETAAAHAGVQKVIEPENLPARLTISPRRDEPGTRRSAERAAVEEALRASSGNLSAAAKRLGIARTTLYRMMKKHKVAP